MNTFKRLANRALDMGFVPGTERFWRRHLHGHVMALVFHRVDEPDRVPFLTKGGTPVIRPESLEAELSFLLNQGAVFLTFADLLCGRFPGDSEFGVVVTFDDGFRDNYTTGLQVLDAVGVKAVFFQASAMVDGLQLVPEHALYWYAHCRATRDALVRAAEGLGIVSKGALVEGAILRLIGRWIRETPIALVQGLLEEVRSRTGTVEPVRKLYPASDDLRRAMDGGHEIASHGHNHICRTTIDAGRFEKELADSVERLEAICGRKPQAFSYPFNSYREGDKEICGRYFQQVATVDNRFIEVDSDPRQLGRFSWPGEARNSLRFRRWLLTGRI